MAIKTLKGNVGEWSEIYTFLKVLSDGKLDVADEKLNAVPGEFYKIIAILRNEAESSNSYFREQDCVHFYVTNHKTGEIEEFKTTILEFANNAKLLLNHLKYGTGRSRQYPDIESFLNSLKIHSIKDVGNKRDITIKIEDFHCGLKQTLGFSIKSLIGRNSTLFNAGKGTNFIYNITFPSNTHFDMEAFNKETYNAKEGKITARIVRLENEYGATIKFSGVQSPKFYQNLLMIDMGMPEVLGEMLLAKYRHKLNTVRRCVEKLNETNPLHFNLSLGQPFYEYKIKRFLQDSAMGMTSEAIWTGVYDATGGQIIVKDSGDIVCYHIYEQNRFLNYLLDSTYFEQPATSEDASHPGHVRPSAKKDFNYGWVYAEGGQYWLKLNLQVRMRDLSAK